MAVFLMNVCKFEGCGMTFQTLGNLIQHIEETHIDFDPRVLEKQESQQPPCIPISYVLRFFTDAAKKESLDYLKGKQIKRSHSPAVSVCSSTTPSGSDEFDDEDVVSESEDSNDSWTTQEEFSSEFIMRYGSRIVGNPNPNEEKPFACPVPGCKKRYKNINGIKYHAKNGHRKDARIKKAYRCHCGKSYKTAKGLRTHNHVVHYHHLHGGNGGANHVVPVAIADTIPVGDHVGFGNGPSLKPSSPYNSLSNGNYISIGTQLRLAETPPCTPCNHHVNASLLPTTPPPTPTSSSSSSSSSSSPPATLSTVTTPTYAVCSPPPPRLIASSPYGLNAARGISATTGAGTTTTTNFSPSYPASPASPPPSYAVAAP